MLRSWPPRSPSESFLLSSRLVFTRFPGALGTIEGAHYQARMTIAAAHLSLRKVN